MSHDVSTCSQGEGNMDSSPSVDFKARKWIFTLNNWTDQELSQCLNVFNKKNWLYIIGKEIGEQGTPHLQGYVEHKNQIRRSVLVKILPRAYIHTAQGDIKSNYKYCSKTEDFITNISELEDDISLAERKYNQQMIEDYKDIVWKPWQQEVIDIINTKPDDRTVHWVYEPKGNVGKSFLVKYLQWKYDAIVANGKQSDVFNQYKVFIEEKKDQPKLALIDIPRSNENYINYSTLEKIKDGLFYSGKYEGGVLRLCRHHLICFANFLPDKFALSNDRWHFINATGTI